MVDGTSKDEFALFHDAPQQVNQAVSVKAGAWYGAVAIRTGGYCGVARRCEPRWEFHARRGLQHRDRPGTDIPEAPQRERRPRVGRQHGGDLVREPSERVETQKGVPHQLPGDVGAKLLDVREAQTATGVGGENARDRRIEVADS